MNTKTDYATENRQQHVIAVDKDNKTAPLQYQVGRTGKWEGTGKGTQVAKFGVGTKKVAESRNKIFVDHDNGWDQGFEQCQMI